MIFRGATVYPGDRAPVAADVALDGREIVAVGRGLDAEGVVGVWVAGQAVWRDGGPTGARPGGVLR